MFRKIYTTIIFLFVAFCGLLIAGQEVNQVVATLNLPQVPWGYSSEDEVDFIAPGTGKYKITFECGIEDWNQSYSAWIDFLIYGIYPEYHSNQAGESIPSWQDHLTRTIYVDLEEGVEYTLYAYFYNSWITLTDVTVTATYKYTYERDFMVSLPFNEYFQNVGDFITFNSMMADNANADGSYFDFTGYAWADPNFNIYEYHPNFQMDFQGTINDIVTIHPPFNFYDLTEHIYFQETYIPCPFLNNCSNSVEYLGDFEMVDYAGNHVYFGDISYPDERKFNFEYAPNYANLTEEEFTVASSYDCHPFLQWPEEYANFFTINGLEDYFVTQIERRKCDPSGNPIELWSELTTISPACSTYKDESLESPDPDPEPGGMFAIKGIAQYRIRLQQTSANPNYGADWANQICGESPTHGIYYGHNEGGAGNIKPKLYGVFNLNVTGFHNPTISFTIKDNSYANTSVKIYNITGQLVKTLLDEPLGKGPHTLAWNGTDKNNRNVSSGIYLIQICRGNERTARKISLLK
ncbi:MAG: T9SS type A sorting domain-containing protein [Candidatus Cloacimonetes bacterium]|nr:T9SS type A sorting domain-containing protein [Candidatus Cloacimonadota bacterium]MBL7086341.1 T9SS type A sorting domain-containing protein [Candidatus Cloacimonadota bacterium]